MTCEKQLAERDARIAELESYIGYWEGSDITTADHIKQLERQLAEARKDAERYRWLKPRWYWDDERDMGPGGRYWVAISVKKGRPQLDAAIDSAIKEDAG